LKYENPKTIKKYEKKLTKLQRQLANKTKGSRNYQKKRKQMPAGIMRESNFMVVPIAKKVMTIIAGRALVSIFFMDGKKLPSRIPRIIGSTAPSKDQLIGD